MVGLALVAFLLLLAGAFLLALDRYVWDAGLFILVALVTLGAMYLRRQALLQRWWACWRGWTARWAGLTLYDRAGLTDRVARRAGMLARGGALFVSLAVALAARRRGPDQDFTLLFLFWLGAVILFAASLVVRWLRDAPPHLSLARWEVWGLVALILVSLLVRGAALGRVPANLGGDEGTQLAVGMEMVAPPLNNPFATGWYSVPTMSFFAYGLMMRLAGATVAGGRALSVLVGTLTVVTTWMLGRTALGRRQGWIAAVVLAFSSYHIHFSRLASNQIIDPLVGTLVFWLVWVGLRPGAVVSTHQGVSTRQGVRWAWGLAGLVAGLGWYAYFGARWVSFMVALVVAWRWALDHSFLRHHGRDLLLFAAGLLVAVLPLLGWYSVHPSALTERYNAVSVFASGWLAREIEITGKTALQLMLQQAWKSLTAFHLTPDPTFWYRPQRPLVDFVTGALLLLGLLEALIHLRWPSRALTLIWYGSTVVMAWVMTENPPSSQRGLLLAPVVVILVAGGFSLLRRVFTFDRRVWRWTVAALLVVMAAANLTFYFVGYTPQRIYGNPTAEMATTFARHTLAHPEPVCRSRSADVCPGTIYFLGPPRLYWSFGTLAFMLHGFPGQDVTPEVGIPEVTGPARFAVVPERLGQLDTLRQRYPGGVTTYLRGLQGQLLMAVYDWPG